MKTVRVYQLGNDFESHEVGHFAMTDGRIEADPPSALLTEMLATPIAVPVNGVPHRVTSDNPDLFMAGLCLQYRSAYLKCAPVEDVDDSPIAESLLVEGFDESQHPRDDNGRFVSAAAIAGAAKDPKKLKALQAKVTNPDQMKKLESAIKAA